MKEILPVWGIAESYDAHGNLLVHIMLPIGFNVTNGVLKTLPELVPYGITEQHLDNYIPGEPIYLFEAFIDPSQKGTTITKQPSLWIHDNCCFTQLALSHPNTNGDDKKVKKTSENVSNVKPA